MLAFLREWLDSPMVKRLTTVSVLLVIIVVARRWLSTYLGRHVEDIDTRYRVRKFVTFASYAASVLVIVTVFSGSLREFTVALGVASAGIAFALQELISSVAGFVALTFSRFYSPGDRVELGGIKGDVIDIGILRTTLAEVGDWVDGDLYNGRVVRVANSFVFKAPVFNYSADFPFLWDEIKVPVRYGSDRAEARRLLEHAATAIVEDLADAPRRAWNTLVANYRLEDTQLDPVVTLVANDNWLQFTVRYVVDYRHRRRTKDRLYTHIMDAIDATNGCVMMASATFELVAAPQFRVAMAPPASP